MDGETLMVLLIEDNPGDALLVQEMLSKPRAGALRLEWAEQLSDGLARLRDGSIDAILLDLTLPDSRGLETFLAVRAHAPDTAVIVLSGLDDEELAVHAVQQGAQDYLVKGRVDADLLSRAIRYAIERGRLARERSQLLEREQLARAQAEAAQRRLAFLAEASRVLAHSLDYGATLETVARLVVPDLADWCTINIVQAEGGIQRLAENHSDPDKLVLLRELGRRYPPDPSLPHPTGKVLRTGEPELVPEVSAEWLEAHARDAGHLQLLSALGYGSYMCVPLAAWGQVRGTISLATAKDGRRFIPDDLALAQELAARAALALENARLYGEAQRAIQMRDDFLATAAHDLRSPLTAAKGHAQFLRRQLARRGGEQPGWVSDGLRTIETSMNKMSLLLKDLLDLARLQRGEGIDLDRRPVDLVALLRQAVAEHQQVTENHSLNLEAAASTLSCMCDATRLERVIGNLLTNAIKYSPGGGVITISVVCEDGWAVLRVSDQGLGIPASDLPHIFERYRRGSNVVGRVSGMGIGLAGARQIVEEHGGRMAIESQEGVGTTVTVWLPVVSEPGAAVSH